MPDLDRRRFLQLAAALGATLATAGAHAVVSSTGWRERRDLYPQGVASGDPDHESVLLWTRRPFADGRDAAVLRVEVAEDPAFARVVATAHARVLARSDWTCRVLVGGLAPSREYWYRFVDDAGHGSRIGRTLTAPHPDDPRPARFAFVSCQTICEGAQNAYRRMIFEDERAAPHERLGFVLHLGDFVYEVVQYPEQVKDGRRYDRTVAFPIRFLHGKAVAGDRFHVPASLEDYRTLYRAYLEDPDIQDARARFAFVPIWDNHEFSWQGWQSIQDFGDGDVPAQTLKVAANQAWFEFQPARVAAPGGRLDAFDAPRVDDVPVTAFDDAGLGREPNNLAAIDSLVAYRALRWGRHVELVITDQRSYRSRDVMSGKDVRTLSDRAFPSLFPEDVAMALDAGREAGDGRPPETLVFGDRRIANPRRDAPAQTLLGARQKAWFLERLRGATATWKIWGNSLGTLDWRADPQNLPADAGAHWPGDGYACFGGGDWGTAYRERAEIFDAVRDAGITGFAILSGDRHSFWAGLAAKALPPADFAPVGVAFVTGSISAVGMAEALEHALKGHPMRALYVADRADGPHTTLNLLLRHGVRSALAYARGGSLADARAASNPALSPHLAFVDMAGHGYATVDADGERIACDFVCIPRPLVRSAAADGGPLRYRIRHEARLWRSGEPPRLVQTVVEGDPGLGA